MPLEAATPSRTRSSQQCEKIQAPCRHSQQRLSLIVKVREHTRAFVTTSAWLGINGRGSLLWNEWWIKVNRAGCGSCSIKADGSDEQRDRERGPIFLRKLFDQGRRQ